MKKLSLVLALCLLVTALSACSGGIAKTQENTLPATRTEEKTTEEPEYTIPTKYVSEPLKERPNYVLHEGATPEEMRATAVKAMRDELTLLWYPDHDLDYMFTSAIPENSKDFHLKRLTTYAGLPYTNAITSLFHFLEYYDTETGSVAVPAAEVFNAMLGNQCAGGVLWGWASCVSSFDPRSTGFGRTAENLVKVGPYDLPDYSVEKSSMKICEMNGAQKLYESYALLLPADIVVSTGNPGDAGHLMMVVEEPKIVRNADGTIDGKQSTVAIQDQRGGARQNTSEYVKSENGESRHYSGRTYAPLTFESLFNTYYLPYSCLEFAGEREYIMPNVSTDVEIASLEDLNAATLKSQYLLCVFYVRAYNQAGESVYDRSILTTYEEMKAGKLKNFPLSDLKLSKTALSRNVKERGELTFVITCLDATGTEHEFARFNATV